MLTEAIFCIKNEGLHKKIREVSMLKFYEIVEKLMIALDADILALNTCLNQD
jgi:hypothetical protein